MEQVSDVVKQSVKKALRGQQASAYQVLMLAEQFGYELFANLTPEQMDLMPVALVRRFQEEGILMNGQEAADYMDGTRSAVNQAMARQRNPLRGLLLVPVGQRKVRVFTRRWVDEWRENRQCKPEET